LCEALKDTYSLGPSAFNEAEWKAIKALILATQKRVREQTVTA